VLERELVPRATTAPAVAGVVKLAVVAGDRKRALELGRVVQLVKNGLACRSSGEAAASSTAAETKARAYISTLRERLGKFAVAGAAAAEEAAVRRSLNEKDEEEALEQLLAFAQSRRDVAALNGAASAVGPALRQHVANAGVAARSGNSVGVKEELNGCLFEVDGVVLLAILDSKRAHFAFLLDLEVRVAATQLRYLPMLAALAERDGAIDCTLLLLLLSSSSFFFLCPIVVVVVVVVAVVDRSID